MARESFASLARRRLLGLGYIGVIIGLISLSIAVYNKDFTSFVVVKLQTPANSNQLLLQSDVKQDGLIVGSVKSITTNGNGATITLDLSPNKASQIPNNVTAEILPKTLFGEDYVSLIAPAGPPGPPIRSGDTIQPNSTPAALETEKVLGDLYPLLTAVQPAELDETLTAIADALQGRGTELGQVLVNLDSYLKSFNSDVSPGVTYTKQLTTDLADLGKVSTEYNADVPDLVDTLNNLETNAHTLIAQQAAFSSLLGTANSTSNIISSFLGDNEQRLITVVDTSDTIYGILNTYTPEYSCMLAALTQLGDRADLGIQNHQIQLSAQLYFPAANFAQYTQGQEPKFITGVGPNCFGMPNPQVPFVVPANFRCINDGAPLTNDPACAKTTADVQQQAIGSAPETALVDTIVSGTLGTTPNKVPSVAALLVAPALRGERVVVK